MKLSLFSSQPLVGLDIKPGGVCLMQLRKIRNKFLIERVAKADLPNDIFVEGKIKQWDLLCSILSDFVEVLGVRNFATAINLSANLVRMQHIELPIGMKVLDIETEIHAQVARDFPGLTETLCLDFVESASQKQAGYSDIFFVVARQEYVWQYVNCVNKAGLKVKIVDVDIFTLKRLMNVVLPPIVIANEVYALVYALNNIASFIVFNTHNILFHQQWNLIDAVPFHAQLKNRIQIFFATFGYMRIRQLAICAQAHDVTWMTKDIHTCWEGDIYYPDPLSRIPYGREVDVNFLAQHAIHFLIACGSAMREVPKW